MFYKTSFVLLVALVVATTGRAQPVVGVTTTESVNQSVFGGSPNLTTQMRATGTNLGGYEWANDITSTTPTKNDIVNIVEVDHFTAYLTGGTGASRGTSNTANPQTVTLVSATQVQITAVSATAITTQTLSSQIGVYNTPTGLNVLHPASYGATNAAGTTFVTPTALYSLAAAPPLGVVPGANGEGDFLTQAQLNTQGVNTTANSFQQAFDLFKETNNGGFLVIDPSTVPGLNPAGNGQLALVTGQLQSGTLPTLTAADMAALNTIFTNLNPGNGPFGTFGGNPANSFDFNPSPTVATGDGEFSFSVNLDPINFFTTPPGVPEPATLSLWGLLLGSGGIGGVIRRYRSKWARKA